MKNVINRNNLVDRGFFLLLCKNNSLKFSEYQFRWLEENGLITTLSKRGGKNLYSPYQLYSLDVLNRRKQESLDYPDPKYHPAVGLLKTKQISWQNYLLVNKKTILKEESYFNRLLPFLTDIYQIYTATKGTALNQAAEIGSNITLPVVEYGFRLFSFKRVARHQFVSLRARSLRKEVKLVQTKYDFITEEYLNSWENIFLGRVLENEPLIKTLPYFPVLEDIIKSPIAHNLSSSGKLARFYLHLIWLIEFYKNASGQPIKDLALLVEEYRMAERKCIVCGRDLPDAKDKNIKRRVLCDKPDCHKQYHREKARQARIRVKLKLK